MARETEIDLRIKSNIDKVNKDIEKTTDSVEQLGKATEGVNENFDAFGKRAEKNLEKAEKGVDKVTGAVDKVKGVGRDVEQNLGAIEEGFSLIGVESDALAGSIEAVDTAMQFTEGVQGLAEAGQGFLNFGKMGLKAFNVIKAGLISTGIGAIIVGIGVAIGLVATYWDDIVDAFTGEGTSGISKAIKIAFAPLFLTIEAVKMLIEGAKMLWSIITTGSVEAYEEEKKRQAQLEETIKQNEELLEVTKKQQRELERQAKAQEKLYKRQKELREKAISQAERELELELAKNGETSKSIKMTEDLANQKSQSATQELENARNTLKTQKEQRDLAEQSLQAQKEIADALIEQYGWEDERVTEAIDKQVKLRKEYEKTQKVVEDAVESGKELVEAQKDAEADLDRTLIEGRKTRQALYKEARDKRIAFEREIKDAELELLQEGITKERILLQEQYKREREDIMLNEDLTSKQKKALVEANKKLEDKAVEELEKEHQEALTDIDSQAEELRISLMKNSFEQRKAEIDQEYKDQLAEVEANEIMTEEQKTTIRLLYAEQRNQQLNELQAEQNLKELENQITLNEAKQIQSEADFEANMEYRKQQLELERDLELEQADLTAEQKLLIEAQYQKDLQALEDEGREYQRQNVLAKVDLAQQGFAMLGDLVNTFAREDEESQRRAFKVTKAVNLAQAITNTALAVTGALTAGGNPIKLATGAQFVEAGIAGALGLAQIIKIAQTKFESTASDAGGGATSGAGAGGADVISPNFNVVGDSGVNPLEGLDQPPLQAYVVSGNVTSAQSLDRNRIENATI
jgi:hypothetical protein